MTSSMFEETETLRKDVGMLLPESCTIVVCSEGRKMAIGELSYSIVFPIHDLSPVV